MAAPQFLPIPKNLHALACETINRRVNRLPFEKNGVEVTEELVGVTMECINAEVLRTLPVKPAARQSGNSPGLIGCLNERLGGDQAGSAPVIAEVLIDAGLAETAEVLDSSTHQAIRGIRLFSPWTWHIASGETRALAGAGPGSGDSASDAWMAKCPVCKTGILNRITGKRLFGIPPTDFYVDCSHCGAKFIPEKNRFRLVSIAHISDPRWRQYLNSSREPEAWALLAQEAVLQRPERRPVQRRQKLHIESTVTTTVLPQLVRIRDSHPAHPVEGLTVSFSAVKDGSLAVVSATKTLYFKPVPLRFLSGVKHDTFERSEHLMQDMVALPVYADIKENVEKNYPRYLTLRRGPVTAELRQKKDPLYQKILSPYGDEGYSMFCIDEEQRATKKGILLVYAQGKLCLIEGCHTTFSDMIDKRLGHITPDMCFRDGDETACRINTVVNIVRTAPVIYTHELHDDAAIDAAVAELKARYGISPPAA
ncbi:MAG: hypothetical protein LUQ31_07265 [Methanoregula sp.]|nr:hypothetical protein [Methanoregula sp.]